MAGAAEAFGAALVGAGAAWAGWALWCLARAPAAQSPAGAWRVLVDHGPYAFGRHPMYLGLIAATTGAALVSASLAALLGAAALLAFLHLVVVTREEALLRARYGGWYSDYAAETPRWF